MLILILLAIILIAALISAEARNLYYSCASLAVLVTALSFSFWLLGNRDFAIIYLVPEIAVLFYLVRATSFSALPESYKGREFLAYLTVFIFIVVLACSAFPFLRLQPIYLACFLLFCCGIYCAAAKKNLIKIIMGLMLMEYGLSLLLAALGRLDAGKSLHNAPFLIGIVGLATVIVLAIISRGFFAKFGTLDVSKIRNLKG